MAALSVTNPVTDGGSLSNLVAQLTSGDFVRARMRHWLVLADGRVSDRLSVERTPAASAVNPESGVVTWYDYDGQNTESVVGTNDLIAELLEDEDLSSGR